MTNPILIALSVVWENQSENKGSQPIPDYTTSLLPFCMGKSIRKQRVTANPWLYPILIAFLYGKINQKTKSYSQSLTILHPYCLSVWENQSENKELQPITDYTTSLLPFCMGKSIRKQRVTANHWLYYILIAFLYGKINQKTKGYSQSLTILHPYCLSVWENQSENKGLQPPITDYTTSLLPFCMGKSIRKQRVTANHWLDYILIAFLYGKINQKTKSYSQSLTILHPNCLFVWENQSEHKGLQTIPGYTQKYVLNVRMMMCTAAVWV